MQKKRLSATAKRNAGRAVGDRMMIRKLDRIDLRMLDILQDNGRVTNLQLANEVGLSSSPCHVRLRRLEYSGLVRSYHASLDLDRLMHTVMLLVPVELTHHEASGFKKFESRVMEVEEIVECFAVGGGFDYLMRIVTASIDAYQQLMEQLLAEDIGIHRYYTYVVTKPIKRFNRYPLQRLIELSQS
jgi:Lrp/AsnC family transcriptional regulator, regulator of ectoine-degradation genes